MILQTSNKKKTNWLTPYFSPSHHSVIISHLHVLNMYAWGMKMFKTQSVFINSSLLCVHLYIWPQGSMPGSDFNSSHGVIWLYWASLLNSFLIYYHTSWFITLLVKIVCGCQDPVRMKTEFSVIWLVSIWVVERFWSDPLNVTCSGAGSTCSI